MPPPHPLSHPLPGGWTDLPGAGPSPAFWALDPSVHFLNHGSFGSCPRPVLQFQQALRERLERQPVLFLGRELEGLWDEARVQLGTFLGASPEDLVFVPNATTGVNTVLRSYPWERGDEVLVTDHEYNACRNALEEAATRAGARVVVVRLPFPLNSPETIVERILDAVTPRTRLALLDHVTSQTGLILPLEHVIPSLRERGVDTLIDGAHAPGMVPLRLSELGATYYTGNAHKWICAPKGAAFLWVERKRQAQVRPLVISHGAKAQRSDRSRFLVEFGWTGTGDPSAYLSVPEALRVLAFRVPGGWPALLARNHRLACHGRRALLHAMNLPEPCPESMLGSMAAIPLPGGSRLRYQDDPQTPDPLQAELWRVHRIEVPVVPWPMGDPDQPPQRLLRISAQLYNVPEQYALLADALRHSPLLG